MEKPKSLFERLTAKIERGYRAIDDDLGWRFMYTSRRTLSPSTDIVFIGLNPGGNRKEAPMASCENGNAYRTERWSANGLNPLQKQVCGLYDEIAAVSGGKARDELMDTSLAGNFIPFRSKDSASLKSKPSGLELGREVWGTVLNHVKPRLVITMGREVTTQVVAICGRASEVSDEERFKTGWGDVSYDLRWAGKGASRALIIGLPHLSRFRIFGRTGTAKRFEPMRRAIREVLD